MMKLKTDMHNNLVEQTTSQWHQRVRLPFQWVGVAVGVQQINLLRVGIWGFSASIVWAVFAAFGLSYDYQDTWILEGIWLPLAVALGFYLITVYGDLDPAPTAVLTGLLVFAAFSAASLKYTYVYGSTIDAAIHFSMMRNLAEVGRPDNNVYAFTPGMHLLVASLAQLTGLSVTLWVQILPAAVGGLMPLFAYLLWNRLAMPRLLLRGMIILSGLTLPTLYLPDGTTYAILLFIPLITVGILRGVDGPRARRAWTVMTALFAVTLPIWHAISSVLIPLVMGVTAILSLALVREWKRRAYQPIAMRQAATALLVLGVIGFVLALIYWRLIALPIWEQLMINFRVFGAVLEQREPSEGILIPDRAFAVSTADLLMSGTLYHARDGAIGGLVGLGALFNIYALFHGWRMQHGEERYVQIVRMFIIVWVLFTGVLFGVLVLGFAKHGYHRFILYIMAASAPVAGYGLWKLITMIQARLPRLSPHVLMTPLIGIVLLFAGFQLFPYQPLVPRANMPGTDGSTPLFYLHQVNSEFQRLGVEFVHTRIDPDFDTLVDYRSYQQMGTFMGIGARNAIHYGYWPTPRAAYVYYRVPGITGAWGEQAEHRSVEAIEARRNLEGVNTLYDNGGTFVMFVPEHHMEQMYVEPPLLSASPAAVNEDGTERENMPIPNLLLPNVQTEEVGNE